MIDQSSLEFGVFQPPARSVGLLGDMSPAGGILSDPQMALALMMMGRGVSWSDRIREPIERRH
jgi:hypothetical protein